MAIFGQRADCARQVGDHPGFRRAFAFLQEVLDGTHAAAQVLAGLAPGEARRIEIDGDRVYAVLQHAWTRRRDEQVMEAHRVYADVQLALGDAEALEVAPLDGLTVTQPYDPTKDAALYAMPPEASRLLLGHDLCAVLFPTDAHAPLVARDDTPRLSRRIVVKVRDPLGA